MENDKPGSDEELELIRKNTSDGDIMDGVVPFHEVPQKSEVKDDNQN